MYGVETCVLNQAVRRNKERFPDDFMFQLNDKEMHDWRSQIVMSNSIKMGVRRNLYAFTELGGGDVDSVLKSRAAIEVNRGIMRAFVAVHQMVALPHTDKIADLQRQIDDLKVYIEEVFADYNDINEQTGIQLGLSRRQSLAFC